MTSHLSAHLIELFDGLRQKLMEGSPDNALKDLSDALISAGLLAKGAAVNTIETDYILSQEFQWVFPDIQKMVEEALEVGFPEFIIEWALLHAKDKKVLPANILTPTMRYFSKHPDLAVHVVPAIGPRGFQLAKHFDEFALFDHRKWQDPLSFKQRAQRKFAFSLLCLQDPETALQYIIAHFSKMHEDDKKNFLGQILKNGVEENQILSDFLSKGKSQILQIFFVRYCLLHHKDFYEINKEQLQNLKNKNDLLSFQFQQTNGRKFQWAPELVIAAMNPDMISELGIESYFFEYIQQQQMESAFLDSFQGYPKSKLRNQYFKWLIKIKCLTEEFPMEKLTQGMDFISYNACCIEWLETLNGQTDMEAFYKASLHHRHFWSDELCQTIISISKIPEITKKFEMMVFWQLMAFKMNPVSNYANKLPDEYRFRISDHLNFEQVIRFRKFMRKLDKA